MDSKSVITRLLADLGQTTYSLAKTIGVPYQRIFDVKSGKVKRLSVDTIDKIVSKYPQFNRTWLMKGEGDMYTDEKNRKDEREESVLVPYYNVDFTCGYDVMCNCTQVNPDGFVNLPFLKGADCLINASGRSMYPTISEGDIIAVKRLNNIDGILYGEIYAIVTDDYRTIKRVRKSDKEGCIRLVPENREYDEQDIPISSIRGIYKILRAIKNID